MPFLFFSSSFSFGPFRFHRSYLNPSCQSSIPHVAKPLPSLVGGYGFESPSDRCGRGFSNKYTRAHKRGLHNSSRSWSMEHARPDQQFMETDSWCIKVTYGDYNQFVTIWYVITTTKKFPYPKVGFLLWWGPPL